MSTDLATLKKPLPLEVLLVDDEDSEVIEGEIVEELAVRASKKGIPKRTITPDEDALICLERLKGTSERVVGAMFDPVISRDTVRNHYKKFLREGFARRYADPNAFLEEKLTQLEKIAQQAYTSAVEQHDLDSPFAENVLMLTAIRAIEVITKLGGFAAPDKLELSGGVDIDFSVFTVEQLRDIQRGRDPKELNASNR